MLLRFYPPVSVLLNILTFFSYLSRTIYAFLTLHHNFFRTNLFILLIKQPPAIKRLPNNENIQSRLFCLLAVDMLAKLLVCSALVAAAFGKNLKSVFRCFITVLFFVKLHYFSFRNNKCIELLAVELFNYLSTHSFS